MMFYTVNFFLFCFLHVRKPSVNRDLSCLKGRVGWQGKPWGLLPTLIFNSLGNLHQPLWLFVPSSVKCQVVQEWFLVWTCFWCPLPFLEHDKHPKVNDGEVSGQTSTKDTDKLEGKCVCGVFWGVGVGGSVLFWWLLKLALAQQSGLEDGLQLWEAQLPFSLLWLPKHGYPRCGRDYTGYRNGLFFSISGAFALPSWRLWPYW